MTSQIFKQFAAIVVFIFAGVVNINAQQANADDMLQLQSLNYTIMNPHAPQTENVLAQAEETISKMEKMKGADQSDLCTLRGFLYMVRIVQNPAQNGQRYYMDVMQNYEKALRLNPNNGLAQQLQQKFLEGMKQHTN